MRVSRIIRPPFLTSTRMSHPDPHHFGRTSRFEKGVEHKPSMDVDRKPRKILVNILKHGFGTHQAGTPTGIEEETGKLFVTNMEAHPYICKVIRVMLHLLSHQIREPDQLAFRAGISIFIAVEGDSVQGAHSLDVDVGCDQFPGADRDIKEDL